MTYELLAAQKATGNTLNLTNSTTQVVCLPSAPVSRAN